MPTNDAIQLLRRHDPARVLEPVPRDLREKLCAEVLASDAGVASTRSLRGRRMKSLRFVLVALLALVIGVGVAWASGVLSPLAVFQNNVQQQGATPGSLWDQRVVAASVIEAARVEIPMLGAVSFWYGRSEQGGWCGALQLPSGAWVGTHNGDSANAGGTAPGCFPSREAVNKSTTKPVYVINGFDYEEGNVDVRAQGGSFWRIRYGMITIPGAARVADTISGRSAPVVHGDLFALALPDQQPESTIKIHLVAYDAAGKIVGDSCPRCG
jgi:hypothetical protein